MITLLLFIAFIAIFALTYKWVSRNHHHSTGAKLLRIVANVMETILLLDCVALPIVTTIAIIKEDDCLTALPFLLGSAIYLLIAIGVLRVLASLGEMAQLNYDKEFKENE